MRTNSAPVVSGSTVNSGTATFRSLGVRGNLAVSHTELLTTIQATTDFQVHKFQINPGLPNFAPWLSDLAAKFEMYSFKRLRFHFVSTQGTNVPGRLYMASRHDAQELAPVYKNALTTMNGTVASPIWVSSTHEMPRMGGEHNMRKYVRQGFLPTGADIKTFDHGQFLYATDSFDSADESKFVGEIYVTYDVELYNPVKSLPDGVYYNQSSGAPATPYAVPASIAQNGVLSTHLGVDGNAIWFPVPGHYVIDFILDGTSIINNGMLCTSLTTNILVNVISSATNGVQTRSLSSWNIAVKEPGYHVTVVAEAASITGLSTHIALAPRGPFGTAILSDQP